MARSITGGVISERDRLFQYTTGEYYQELSLFITETEQKQKEIDKITKKHRVWKKQLAYWWRFGDGGWSESYTSFFAYNGYYSGMDSCNS